MNKVFSRKLDINGQRIYSENYVRLKNRRQSDDLPDEAYGLYKVVFDNGSFDLQLILNNWFEKNFLSTLEANHLSQDKEEPVLPVTRLPISGYDNCEVVTDKYARALIKRNKDKVEPEPEPVDEVSDIQSQGKK